MVRTLGLPAALGLIAVAMLGACARPTGDFGRAESYPWEDSVPIGVTAISGFNLTDQERDMRNRVWRYLESPQPYERLAGASDNGRAKIEVARYYAWLRKQPFGSSPARFTRLAQDIDTDLATLPATFASICAVNEIDRRRGVAFNGVSGLDSAVARDAAGRQVENRAIVRDFVAAFDRRYESYAYALNHLLVETPHEEAIAANEALTRMATYADAAEGGEFCNGPTASSRTPDPSIRSRFEAS